MCIGSPPFKGRGVSPAPLEASPCPGYPGPLRQAEPPAVTHRAALGEVGSPGPEVRGAGGRGSWWHPSALIVTKKGFADDSVCRDRVCRDQHFLQHGRRPP